MRATTAEAVLTRPAWRQALIDEHAHLVHGTVARMSRYAPPGLETADYVGAGVIGLVKAADKFDPTRGVKFTTLAIHLIRGAILEQIRAWDIVPRSLREKERAGLVQCHLPASLNTPIHKIGGEEELTLGDILQDESPPPVEQAATSMFVDAVATALERLPARERYVFEEHFEGRSFKAIARDLEISESRAYQLNQQATVRLRNSSGVRRAMAAGDEEGTTWWVTHRSCTKNFLGNPHLQQQPPSQP